METFHPTFGPGDPAPWFSSPASNNPNFEFASAAGRYLLLLFFGSAAVPEAKQALSNVAANRAMLDDNRVAFFGVSVDPEDRDSGRVRQQIPGIRFFWDFDLKVSRLFGAVDQEVVAGADSATYRPFWLILDPLLRVMAQLPLNQAARAFEILRAAPPLDRYGGVEMLAPVLIVPRVFEPALCGRLIDYYKQRGGEESGFMREVDGRTVGVYDHSVKKRADCVIEEEEFRTFIQRRISRRLSPEIKKAFQFGVTRMERYIVARYDGADGGFFRAHRDNRTKATAHRQFAVTINLNSEEYEGGNLRFPEFGPRTYRAPTGGAVVFSCSLLHEALPVTSGVRYAFLPFLYDDQAADLRATNREFLDERVIDYRNLQ